ncbi:NAD(P)/FAD-dependent oxidoreductase [Leucobacter sp. M11]|uniref:NAD(P)/FAD-dependent oxidoreductase n=1 Tax=Leucobacter sp. M11 TaxID=2993565 RepID=UPI002D7F220D|nr:FAD-binding oxidoreductase [Leucobacter sp. M11]MEB4613165.1 FAD-binding oxidoreductase [Leucobacter sp. M11]
MKPQHTVVVGGGLIGLCTALALRRAGHPVTLVDRGRLGGGAATGNAGELTPQQVSPLASPNTAVDVFRGVFTQSSYLSIDPWQLPRLARFGLGFIRSAGRTRAARGAAALAQFADELLPAMRRLGAEGIDLSGGGEGYLMTNSDPEQLRAAHAAYGARADRGWGEAPGPILRDGQLAEAEPALHPSVTGGFMLPGEFSLDPVTFVASLIERVRDSGVTVREGLTALRVGEGASIVCSREDGTEETVRGDRLVIAAGAWTTPILRRSRIRSAPVVSGKGYSFTVPVARMPETLIHAMDRHCVAIPMHGRLRIVGMMEFDGHPERPNPRRFEVLTRAAAGVIRDADWANRTEEWVGARPMTADGMPLLGPVAGRPEVIVAAGHNMHGLSLAPITAEVVADLVAGRDPVIGGRTLDLAPFAVRR